MNIRVGDLNTDFYWITIKKGETKDLPETIGKANGLIELKTNSSKIGIAKVETKQIEYSEDDLFLKELIKIKGIGKKVAKDIVVWGTKEKLIESISNKEDLPFRDDIENKLRKAYGK